MWEDIIRESERIQALEKRRVCPMFVDVEMEISEYSISSVKRLSPPDTGFTTGMCDFFWEYVQ